MQAQLEQVAAFQELLGLERLPTDGKHAAALSRQFSGMLLSTVRPAPILTQLVQQLYTLSKPPVNPRFIDVGTGMRLRYLEWNSGGEDAVLLLHDIGECTDVWGPLAERLRQRGYRVIALDLRGHGHSQWSSGGRYTLDLIADDIQAFILEKDLYTRPLAVVGCGLGGAVALALAQRSPHLVGAAVVAEFALPEGLLAAWRAAQKQPEGGCEGGSSSGSGTPAAAGLPRMRQRTDAVKPVRLAQGVLQQGPAAGPAAGTLPSTELLPWWGFSLAQGASFYSVEECAALLCHPLANLGPQVAEPLARAAAATAAAAAAAAAADGGGSTPGEGAAAGAGQQGQDGRGAAAAAQPGSEVRPEEEDVSPNLPAAAPAGATSAKPMGEILAGLQRPVEGAVRSAYAMLRAGPGGKAAWDAPSGGLAPWMDPAFLLTFDVGELLTRLADLRCHLLVLHGAASAWVAPGDAAALAAAAAEAGGARSARAAALPGAGHHLATDSEAELLAAVVAFLEGPAISCFVGDGAAGAASRGAASGQQGPRRPELLDLKPLPQYKTLEQAKKALGPRSIPSAAAIEAELQKLRLEEGGEASEGEEEESTGRYQTALANNPPDYFGFVG